jgi:hypothetical protein
VSDDLRAVITDMREAAATEDVADEWLSIDYWADRLERIADDIEPRLLPRSPSEHVDSLVAESREELDARSERVAELMRTLGAAVAERNYYREDGSVDLDAFWDGAPGYMDAPVVEEVVDEQ